MERGLEAAMVARRCTRRAFLASAAAGAAVFPLAARKAPGLRIGIMDGVLRRTGDPEAAGIAKRLGFEGIQVTLGQPKDGRMPLEDRALQQRWISASEQHALPIDATYIDVLHADCLKNNDRARDWIRRGIAVTRALDARILMTVFFGDCALENPAEIDATTAVFRDLLPEAKAARVILGFENLLSARDNLRVHDQLASPWFKIYYDTGNSTNRGFDAPAEIRELGRDRICQFHFKDGRNYLGEGKVDYRRVVEAIDATGFRGFGNLETSSPSGDVGADAGRNLRYLRGLLEP